METKFPFQAGAMMKWASNETLTKIEGRVILIIETGNQEDALTMRNCLLADAKLTHELLATVRPWPADIVTVDTEHMNRHTSVKEIMEFNPSGKEES